MLDGEAGNVLTGALVDEPRWKHMSFAKIFFAVLAAILAAALVIWIINSASVENARRAETRAFLFDQARKIEAGNIPYGHTAPTVEERMRIFDERIQKINEAEQRSDKLPPEFPK